MSTKIGASLTFTFLILCAGARSIHAYPLPSGFSGCGNLESCLNALDPKAKTSDGSTGPDEEAIAAKLSMFGEPAKIELLKRAAGDDVGWRNLSQSILYNWKIWSPSDVPELQAALRRDHGGWMAKPLATIATPAAIEALVEDLPKGSENQTDFALEKLGPRAVPALMPLLENADTAAPAIRVIKSMGKSVSSLQVEWVQTATNATKPLPERLAALRAISALGSKARQSAALISSLAQSTDSALHRQTIVTLEALQSFEQKFNERAQDVSVIELIANPSRYDGKQVQLIGFLRLEFEGNALYLHQEDFEHAISRNAIWIDRPTDLSDKQTLEINNRYVICQGTFKAGEHGHMGMFSGSLTHISRLEHWAGR